MNRLLETEPVRRAAPWLGVALVALASAAAIAWFCVGTMTMARVVGGFDRSIAAADSPQVVVLPPVTVIARRSDVEPRAGSRPTPRG